MLAPLLPADRALSGPHFASWLSFAAAAGLVNGTAFLACNRFVTHVTGTITRIGLDSGLWLLMAEYSLVLACFVVGAMSSAVILRTLAGTRAFGVALSAAALVLVAVAVLGSRGLFGPFGGEVEQGGDFGLLSLLSFAMGLQNATVASATSLALRTTHMTGPASDLGVHLGTALTSSGDTRRAALRLALLRGTKIAAFIAGAGLAGPAARALGFGSFLLAAAMVFMATLTSLPKKETREHEAASTLGQPGARAAA